MASPAPVHAHSPTEWQMLLEQQDMGPIKPISPGGAPPPPTTSHPLKPPVRNPHVQVQHK